MASDLPHRRIEMLALIRPQASLVDEDPPPRELAGCADLSAEVVAEIVRRRSDGELAADIGKIFGLTPLDVLNVVREAREARSGTGKAAEMSDVTRAVVAAGTASRHECR
jgi:hypothetical protein